MWADGYKEDKATCALDWVQKIDANIYLVHSDCLYPLETPTAHGEKLNEGGDAQTGEAKSAPVLELRLINGQLHITPVPEV